jgi:hypothetical protein
VGAGDVPADHQFLAVVQAVFRRRTTASAGFVPANLPLGNDTFQSLFSCAPKHCLG